MCFEPIRDCFEYVPLAVDLYSKAGLHYAGFRHVSVSVMFCCCYTFVSVFSLGRVCQLLAAGVDVNLKDSPETQSTPLHWAASYGNKDIVQCLCCEF